MGSPLRILMLHGYTRSASAFSRQTGALRKSLKSIAQLVSAASGFSLPALQDYIDGTHEVKLPTEAAEALNNAEGENDKPIEKTLGWWDRNYDTDEYEGSSETFERIADILASASPPYDGILGFSQGGALAVLLAGLAQTPSANAAFERGLKSRPLTPLKFVIVVGGFASVDPAHQKVFARPIEVPSLHVIGKTDFIVDEERSQTAVAVFSEQTRRVEHHPGGHHVPSDARWRQFLSSWIESFATGDNGKSVPPPASLQPSL